tara:strand:+ start:347 stop:973 length:627 start_codon:yes stop_codon:yes gene_type:complete
MLSIKKNVLFLEYSNTLTEKNIIELLGEESVIILINCIANTNIFSIEKSILNITNYEYISTNINYYFGYSQVIKNNITKNNIEDLLCNILYKNENTIIWSDLIIRYYNKHFNSYTNKQIDILNNLLKKIQILYFKILDDIQLLDKKKYDLDIVNKSIYEYISENLNDIIEKLFNTINIFYILSISFNKNNKYLLVYDKQLLSSLEKYF